MNYQRDWCQWPSPSCKHMNMTQHWQRVLISAMLPFFADSGNTWKLQVGNCNLCKSKFVMAAVSSVLWYIDVGQIWQEDCIYCHQGAIMTHNYHNTKMKRIRVWNSFDLKCNNMNIGDLQSSLFYAARTSNKMVEPGLEYYSLAAWFSVGDIIIFCYILLFLISSLTLIYI